MSDNRTKITAETANAGMDQDLARLRHILFEAKAEHWVARAHAAARKFGDAERENADAIRQALEAIRGNQQHREYCITLPRLFGLLEKRGLAGVLKAWLGDEVDPLFKNNASLPLINIDLSYWKMLLLPLFLWLNLDRPTLQWLMGLIRMETAFREPLYATQGVFGTGFEDQHLPHSEVGWGERLAQDISKVLDFSD